MTQLPYSRNPQWIQILRKIAIQLTMNGTRKEKLDVLGMTLTLMQGNSLSHNDKLLLLDLMHRHLTRRYRDYAYPRYVKLTKDQKYEAGNIRAAKEVEELIRQDLRLDYLEVASERPDTVGSLLKKAIKLMISSIYKGIWRK